MTSNCPEPETIAAYLDRLLDENERLVIEEHLAQCEQCYTLLAETVHVEQAMADGAVAAARPVGPRVSLWRGPWIRRLGTIAAVLVCGVAILRFVPRSAGPGRALVDALGDRRLVEPRLTGGFRHAPLRAVRSGQSRADPELLDLYAAAAALEREVSGDGSTPETRGAAGVARLLIGDVDDAVTTLEQASADAPQDGRLRSDLAAAYIVRAQRLGRAADWPQALQAAEQAIALDPRLAEAEFNRALALEALSLREEARVAWQRYLSLDPSSGWAAEAQGHLTALTSGPPEKQSHLPAARTRLLTAVDSADSDAAALHAAIATDPALAGRYFEEEVLAEWAAHHLAGRDALRLYDRAAQLGHALATDDPFAADTIAALETADPGRRAALARGHAAYGRGKAAYDQGRSRVALADLEVATRELRGGGSNFAMLPELYARVLTHAAHPEATSAAIARLALVARDRNYSRMLGRVLWTRGVLQGTSGRLSDALADYAGALQAYESARDQEAPVALHGMMAEALDLLGDHKAGWAHRLRALQDLRLVSNGRRRHVILSEATWAAVDQGRPEVAIWLANQLLGVDQAWGDPAGIAEGYRVRAVVRARLAQGTQAAADLMEARRWLQRSLADDLRMAQHAAEAASVEGELDWAERPHLAIPALDRAIGYFQGARNEARLPGLYLSRGRAHALLGHQREAESDFMAGIRAFEKGRGAVAGDRQVPFFDRSWDLFDEMVSFHVGRQDPQAALSYAERGRGRQLLEALAGPITLPGPRQRSSRQGPAQPMPPGELQQAMPEGAALIYYTVLSNRLLTWTLTRSAIEFFETPLSRAELQEMVRRYRAVLERADPAARDRLDALAMGLGTALLGPLADVLGRNTVLVFVPDDVLQRVPFSALKDPATGRYLVEDHAVGLSPSGTVFAHASSSPSPRAVLSALVVGNPLAGAEPGSLRPDLPHAEAEAAQIGALYGTRVPLTRERATRSRFLEGLRHHDVIHFGGHAISDSEVYSFSRLLLTPDEGHPGSGDLFLHDLPPGRLARVRLFVLAACRTGGGPLSRSEGVFSLARPLLAQGVPAVVTSLWDVDDEASRHLLVVFHRSYLDSRSSLQALRTAQKALLNGSDPRLRHPSAWAAYISMGGDPSLAVAFGARAARLSSAGVQVRPTRPSNRQE